MDICLRTFDFQGNESPLSQHMGAWHDEQESDWMIDDAKQNTAISSSAEPVEAAHQMRFTRDKCLIAEYKKLRAELYNTDPLFVGFRLFNDTAAEDYEDPDNQMLIMHDDNRVYGGGCVRISTPQQPLILQVEEDIIPTLGKFYFSLREQFPELELDKYAHAEFSRFVLHPDVRTSTTIRRTLSNVLQRCLDYRVRYLFALSDKVRTRLYKQIYTNVGVECTLSKDLDIPMRPEFEGVKMHLLYGDLKGLYTTPEDLNASCLLEPRNDFEFY